MCPHQTFDVYFIHANAYLVLKSSEELFKYFRLYILMTSRRKKSSKKSLANNICFISYLTFSWLASSLSQHLTELSVIIVWSQHDGGNVEQ